MFSLKRLIVRYIAHHIFDDSSAFCLHHLSLPDLNHLWCLCLAYTDVIISKIWACVNTKNEIEVIFCLDYAGYKTISNNR